MNFTDKVNYVLDTQYDYNIKLILLALFTVYILIGVWYVNRLQIQYLYQFYIRKIVYSLAVPYFIFLPLYIFFLQRTLDVNVFLRLILFFYGGFLVVGFVLFLLFGGEKIKKFFTSEGFYRRYNK